MHLVEKVDHLIIGGGMANTFLAARWINVGKSLCDHDLTESALEILDRADKADCTVHLPHDVVVANEFRANPPTRVANVHAFTSDVMILDVRPAAVETLHHSIKTSRYRVWNGRIGKQV